MEKDQSHSQTTWVCTDHFWAVQPQASCLTSLCLSFLVCQMRKILETSTHLPSSQPPPKEVVTCPVLPRGASYPIPAPALQLILTHRQERGGGDGGCSCQQYLLGQQRQGAQRGVEIENGLEQVDVPEKDVPVVGRGPQELVLVLGHAQNVLLVEVLPVVARECPLGLVGPAHRAGGRRADGSALLLHMGGKHRGLESPGGNSEEGTQVEALPRRPHLPSTYYQGPVLGALQKCS